MKQNKKIAVICNHNYNDFQELFDEKSKIDSKLLKNKLFFITNFYTDSYSTYFKIPSSFSKKPFFDKFFLLDFILAQYLTVLLYFKGVRYIHFTTSHSTNLFHVFLAKLLRINLIFTVHRFDLDSYDLLRKILLKIYNKLVVIVAYKVVILSETNLIPPSKKVLIPLSGFNLNINKPKNIGKYFLFFGRIDDYKGLDDLYITAKSLNDIHFVVAGNGKSKYINKLETLENVKVINRFIEQNELDLLFNDAIACILPYKNASQSGVQILSYSYATPVIVNDVGNLKSFIVDGITGFLVKNNETITEKIKLFDDINLYDMSNNCINYFNTNFSNNVLKKQYKRFYENLIK